MVMNREHFGVEVFGVALNEVIQHALKMTSFSFFFLLGRVGLCCPSNPHHVPKIFSQHVPNSTSSPIIVMASTNVYSNH